MQERVNKAGLRFVKKPTCKVSLQLASENLNFRRALGIRRTEIRRTGPELYTVVYPEHLLSFGESGTLVCARQSVCTRPGPSENLGVESLGSSLVDLLHTLLQFFDKGRGGAGSETHPLGEPS